MEIFESKKQQKLSRILKEEISDLFLKDFKHLCQSALVSITMVRVSPDLSFAKIYLSIMGNVDKKAIVDEINLEKSEIRFQLGKRIRHIVRRIPEIHFIHDDTIDYIERIEKALKK